MGSLGFGEIALLLLIALFVFGFGARKLPDIGKGLGEGIRNFRRAMKGEEQQKDEEPPK
jgi:sec-independent protein translocase protein TatA